MPTNIGPFSLKNISWVDLSWLSCLDLSKWHSYREMSDSTLDSTENFTATTQKQWSMISLPLYSFLSSLKKSLITVLESISLASLFPMYTSNDLKKDLKDSCRISFGMWSRLLVSLCFVSVSVTKILDENFRQKF